MPYEFEKAPLWGRSLKEYDDMFRLSDFSNKQNILGCADGPASFNYEASRAGHTVLSLDPIYKLPAKKIKKQIENTADVITDMVKKNKDDYNWSYLFNNPNHLKECRLRNMNFFLKDYEKNRSKYICGELPSLPFKSNEFSLALVSNFLFLYDNHLDFNFHLNSVIELTRVATEVRIFPISSSRSGASTHIPCLTKSLSKIGYKIETFESNYTFIKETSKTLIVRKQID